jgi:hypothetical protein
MSVISHRAHKLTTFKGYLNLALVPILVIAPRFIDFSKVDSMLSWNILYTLSVILSLFCLKNGLADLKYVKQSTWTNDEMILPLAVVLSIAWLWPLP